MNLTLIKIFVCFYELTIIRSIMPKVFDKKLLIIYGPTATGKTNLAIRLAKKFNGELISADSRQVYKGLDIGSGKVSFESKVEKHRKYWIVNGVKIHGFDLVNPGQNFSVADFLSFASTTMIQIIGVKKLPIVVGGTGFYIKALIDGVESIGVPSDPALRQQLSDLSVDQLYQKLVKLDPDRVKTMNESDRANPRRLVRAIEIATYNKKLKTRNLKQKIIHYQLPTTNYQLVGLTAPNHFLYNRSDKWLEERLSHGMVDEVKNLLDQKVKPQWLDDFGLEYRWLTRYLLGQITKEKAINRLRGDIHSFIRRQKTWFRQFPNIYLFDISKPSWRQKLEKIVSLCYTQTNATG